MIVKPGCETWYSRTWSTWKSIWPYYSGFHNKKIQFKKIIFLILKTFYFKFRFNSKIYFNQDNLRIWYYKPLSLKEFKRVQKLDKFSYLCFFFKSLHLWSNNWDYSSLKFWTQFELTLKVVDALFSSRDKTACWDGQCYLLLYLQNKLLFILFSPKVVYVRQSVSE